MYVQISSHSMMECSEKVIVICDSICIWKFNNTITLQTEYDKISKEGLLYFVVVKYYLVCKFKMFKKDISNALNLINQDVLFAKV